MKQQGVAKCFDGTGQKELTDEFCTGTKPTVTERTCPATKPCREYSFFHHFLPTFPPAAEGVC